MTRVMTRPYRHHFLLRLILQYRWYYLKHATNRDWAREVEFQSSCFYHRMDNPEIFFHVPTEIISLACRQKGMLSCWLAQEQVHNWSLHEVEKWLAISYDNFVLLRHSCSFSFLQFSVKTHVSQAKNKTKIISLFFFPSNKAILLISYLLLPPYSSQSSLLQCPCVDKPSHSVQKYKRKMM